MKEKVIDTKQVFTRRIEIIETSLLEVINNLKIALIREYIKNNDYDEACTRVSAVFTTLDTRSLSKRCSKAVLEYLLRSKQKKEYPLRLRKIR